MLQQHARKHILVKVKHSARKFCVNYDLQVFHEDLFQTIRMWQPELTHLETFTVKFVETGFQYICFVNRERFRRLMCLLRYLRFRACPSGCGAQYKICARGSSQQGVCDVFVLSQPCYDLFDDVVGNWLISISKRQQIIGVDLHVHDITYVSFLFGRAWA